MGTSAEIYQTTESIPANFLNLPSELRNTIYELCLVPKRPLKPWDTTQKKPAASLLRVNRAVHREARFVFYGQNRFDFSSTPPARVASFLETIGRNNAECIQHINIHFPNFDYPNLGSVTLGRRWKDTLANIERACSDLRTLTIPSHCMDEVLGQLDPEVTTEYFTLVNSHLRAIPSIQHIIVEEYDGGDKTSHAARREMENYGWIFNIKYRGCRIGGPLINLYPINRQRT